MKKCEIEKNRLADIKKIGLPQCLFIISNLNLKTNQIYFSEVTS